MPSDSDPGRDALLALASTPLEDPESAAAVQAAAAA
ncbi:MAG: hypothetical protein JWO90_179, partial [Solirubrobacterales bacterium]|nr:hypothetical protein [Solirubrobacterales bacterium]